MNEEYLKTHQDEYAPFLVNHNTVAEFCTKEVDPMGREADHLHIVALTSSLQFTLPSIDPKMQNFKLRNNLPPKNLFQQPPPNMLPQNRSTCVDRIIWPCLFCICRLRGSPRKLLRKNLCDRCSRGGARDGG